MPGVLHRVAAHAQQVLPVLATGDIRHLDVVLDVLLGQQRLTGGDAAEHRDAARQHGRLHGVHRRRGVVARRTVEQLDRPRLRRIAPQHPTFSRLARCACTVDDDASPTAFPMSRTVGG